MSRYKPVTVDSPYEFAILDTINGHHIDDRYFTEAEAHIIAFALNAVAEGEILMIGTKPLRTIHQGIVPGEHRSVIFYVGDAEVYDQPTEGVAP